MELLQGRFSKGVMERICRQGNGLFPKPAEIRFSCSCPDYASMCKHVAAVLYGVGARLDAQPELLFRLRAVDENDLVARIDQALPMAKQGPPPARCWRPTICRRCSVWIWMAVEGSPDVAARAKPRVRKKLVAKRAVRKQAGVRQRRVVRAVGD